MEWALALLRTPSQRHALRQMELPAGVDRLLAVAGGHASSEALEPMVRAFAEPADRLIEAARFYAREVLFFPGADAYRVLGVSADADAELIKLHHRLLQQWLHPDRPGGQDDAVFAARVNAAWNALRTEERRIAYYDKAMAIAGGLQERAASVETDAGQIWVSAAPPGSARWHQWIPMMALMLVCAVLVWLVLRDMERLPEGSTWKEPRIVEDAGKDALGLRAPESAVQVLPVPALGKSSARPLAEAVATPAPVVSNPLPAITVAAAAESRISDAHDQRMDSRSGDARATAPSLGASLPIALPGAQSGDIGPPAPTMPPVGDEIGVDRLRLANQTGQALVRYMDNPLLPPPPIWNSPAMQSSADDLRRELQVIGDGRLENIQLRFARDAAVLTADYRMSGGLDSQVPARIVADIVWREQQWLVTGVGMVKTQ